MKKTNKNHSPRKSEASSQENTVNIIAEKTEITGKINTQTSLRLDGKVIGEITVKEKFVVGRKANQEGDVHCMIAEITGNVKGNIHADKVYLKSTANLLGNIITNQLIIEAGANFTGECKMNDTQDSPSGTIPEKAAERN